MSIFEKVPLLPEDPILGIIETFRNDPRKEKVDLSVGVFRNERLETIKLASVLEAEKRILEKETTKNYLPIQGNPLYIEKSKELVFGKELLSRWENQIVGAQTVGATAALRIGAEIIKKYIGTHVYVSTPTWPNHIKIMKATGLETTSYPYYDETKHEIDFSGLCECAERAETNSVFLIQPSCHNPTGCDLSQEQWKELSMIFQKKNLVPFFDMAYQGLGKGLDEDALAIRTFVESGLELLLSTSYSKNFGLYGERVGCFFTFSNNKERQKNILSVIKSTIREIYSNPPLHGAAIVAEILSDPTLREKWLTEVLGMRKRIQHVREQFVTLLIKETRNDDFSFLTNRYGLFSYSGLKKEQVKKIIEDYGIYMTSNGRINITGLNEKNIHFVVDAIAKNL